MDLDIMRATSGQWVVRLAGSTTTVLATQRTQELATRWAVEHAGHRGGPGTVTVHKVDGGVARVIRVPAGSVPGTDRLGWADIPTSVEDVEAIEIEKLLPDRIRTDPAHSRSLRQLAIGAWAINMAGAFGTGVIGGLLALIDSPTPGAATVGDTATVATAFMVTFALSLTAAVAAFALRTRGTEIAGASGAIFALCAVLIGATALAGYAGVGGPSFDDVLTAASAGDSYRGFGTFGRMVGVFFDYFGVLPCLLGVIAGVTLGMIASNYADRPA